MARKDIRAALKAIEAKIGDTTDPLGIYPASPTQQQGLTFCIESRTSDPVSPYVGQIWIRIDI